MDDTERCIAVFDGFHDDADRKEVIDLIQRLVLVDHLFVDAEWQAEDNGGSLYTVEISVYANNRTGLLVDISKIFTERKIDLAAMNVRTSKQGTASIDVTFDVHNNEELNSIIEKVRQVESVIDIQRSRG